MATWLGVLVSASVGTVAIWQARTAKRQAAEARRSADAAEQQVLIANRQLAISTASTQKEEIEEKRAKIRSVLANAYDIESHLEKLLKTIAEDRSALMNRFKELMDPFMRFVDDSELFKYYSMADIKQGVGFQIPEAWLYVGRAFMGLQHYVLGIGEVDLENLKDHTEVALKLVSNLTSTLTEELVYLDERYRGLQVDESN